MHKNALQIPPDALTDEDAFEIMRLWVAHGYLHTIISSDMQGGAKDFGELLADFFEHASRMYAERDERPLNECKRAMLEEFNRRMASPNDSIEGGLPVEH
ncbi:MAG: DUF5076 domain-containing protein [Steroidobacteraceae bacterium]